MFSGKHTKTMVVCFEFKDNRWKLLSENCKTVFSFQQFHPNTYCRVTSLWLDVISANSFLRLFPFWFLSYAGLNKDKFLQNFRTQRISDENLQSKINRKQLLLCWKWKWTKRDYGTQNWPAIKLLRTIFNVFIMNWLSSPNKLMSVL